MFDNICKFLVENFPGNFATWLLGEEITLTKLSPKELSLEPIRTDALILLQSDELILHIEFQTEPDKKIPFRMAGYRLRAYRRFPDKRMRQVVVYLRQTDSELVYQTSFTLEETSHRFQVIRLWEQPTEEFLETPGLLPFAVLSNTPNQTSTLQAVAAEIENISDKNVQNNVTASTAILAGLVLEEEAIKRLLRRDIMRESVIYQSIKQEGREEGVRGVAVNLLKGGMSLELVAKATGLTVEQVQQLQELQTTQAENPEE
jgi:predicted transposase/invertase (TIGR01784 family)